MNQNEERIKKNVLVRWKGHRKKKNGNWENGWSVVNYFASLSHEINKCGTYLLTTNIVLDEFNSKIHVGFWKDKRI